MMQQLSPALRPKEGSYYYKKHSEHAGFHDVVAKAKEANEAKDDNGKIMEAEVQEKEGNAALLKEAEGVDLADLEKV